MPEGYLLPQTVVDNLMQYTRDNPVQFPQEANLGLATNEELFRELICRFKMTQYSNRSTGIRIDVVQSVDRALELSEMLGGMSAPDREYRTVGHD